MDENGTQTWTLYDGSTPIMDFNSSGSLEMRYLNGPTGQLVDSVLARESSGETVAWYLPDRLGTIRDLINNSGSIIDHIDFSAFGTVLDQSDPSEGDRMMGFAGMELDSVTGMNLAVYRVQDPGTGRWTSQDPLGLGAGDADLYRYVGNGPINAADPLGLTWTSNWNYLMDWFRGSGDRVRKYGPGTTETKELRKSEGGQALRDSFYLNGCKGGRFSFSTGDAFVYTIMTDFWSQTGAQVGGFTAISINNGDGTVTFRIYNVSGTFSFFGHAFRDRDSFHGPGSNIYQFFEWTEPIDPGRCGLPRPRPKERAPTMRQSR